MANKIIQMPLWQPYKGKIEVNQHEALSRTLFFNLIDSSGVPIDLTSAAVVFNANSPSMAEPICGECNVLDAPAGKISHLVEGDMCLHAESVTCFIEIIKDDFVLRTQNFEIEVKESNDNTEAVEASSEFTALVAALATTAGLDSRITQNEDDLADLTPNMSLEKDEDGLHLVNDEETPDEGDFYGYFDGTKGYHELIRTGTFEPIFFGDSVAGTPTYSQRSGKYIKIGNFVVATGHIYASDKGGMQGNIYIGQLPFAIAQRGAGSIGSYSGISTRPTLQVEGSYYQVPLIKGGATDAAYITHADLPLSVVALWGFTIAYFTS